MNFNLGKSFVFLAGLGLVTSSLGQSSLTQEDLWRFSHSIAIPSMDTPWLAPGCYVYPHSAASSQAYVANGCVGSAQSYNWTLGTITPYYLDGQFTQEDFGTRDLSDLNLIIPNFPNEPSCGVKPKYNQYADIDNDGINERIVHIYGCFSDSGPLNSYVLDYNGQDWTYTEYLNALLFAADTDNDGQLELVDLLNDFNGSYIGDGYFKYLDLDNNGYRDFVFFYDHDTEWGVWLNNGDGTFSQLTGNILNPRGRFTNFTDFNNDGKLDVTVFENSTLSVYENITPNSGTWVRTGANFGDEVIINGQAIAFHPEDISSRALTIGDPVHVAGNNPTVQVVAKTTPPLQSGSSSGSGGSGSSGGSGGSTGGSSGGTGGEEPPTEEPPTEEPPANSPPVTTSAYGDAPSSGTVEVIPNSANSNYVASGSEIVTMGIPFSACRLTGSNRTDDFRLLDENGEEVPVFVKETLTWPAQSGCGSESTRALKVQFEFDARDGYKTYSWDLLGRSTPTEFESPIAEILTSNPRKGSLYEPRVFVVHEPSYLVATGLIPPTTVATTDVYDANYYPDKWEHDGRDFDYTSSTVANWLFDRTSASYRQAIRRGDLEHYREAYLSHEFYVERIDDNNVPDDNGQPQSGGNSCVGGWAMGNIASYCDPKFIYSEPIKLHLALTGDDSWQPDPNDYANTREAMWKQMSDILVRGDNRIWSNGAAPEGGFIEPYSDPSSQYTERYSGIGLTTVLNSCQLTLDTEVCSWVDQIVDNIYQHQVSNPDGLGNDGSLRHSWQRHEGADRQWVGTLAVNNGTTIEVADTIGTAKLVAGDQIRIGANTWADNDYTLASAAVDLGGGRWRLTLTGSVSASVGQNVYSNRSDMDGDRAFSIWMSVYVADALWQYYHWTTDADRKEKAAAVMLGLGHAVTKYGIWGGDINPPTEALIEDAFSTPQETIEFYRDPDLVIYGGGGYCGLTVAPFTYYASSNRVNVAGKGANVPWVRGYLNAAGDYANQHLPDVLFLMSTAIFFESDGDRRSAMEALAVDMLDWFDKYDCTAGNKSRNPGAINDPPRAFAWQNKPDPYGTYKWVMASLNGAPNDDGTGNGGTNDNDVPPWENENLVSNPDLPWLAPFNGITPDQSLNLGLNNIGTFSELNQFLYTCIRIMLYGQPIPLYQGIYEFDVVFEVIPGTPEILRIVNVREFNAELATNENNELPDCSGEFELSDNTYTDVLQVAERTYGIVAKAANSERLELILISATEYIPVSI